MRIEIAWLLGSWAFSWLLLAYFLGLGYLGQKPSDIQMHNTYFVVSNWVITFSLFLPTATLVTGLRVLGQALKCYATNAVLVLLASIWLLLVALLAAARWLLP